MVYATQNIVSEYEVMNNYLYNIFKLTFLKLENINVCRSCICEVCFIQFCPVLLFEINYFMAEERKIICIVFWLSYTN